MGNGIWILIWDAWGSGLNMINPRLFVDKGGNNWFVLKGDVSELTLVNQIFKDNQIDAPRHFKIITQ
jgi:hypothetical protein